MEERLSINSHKGGNAMNMDFFKVYGAKERQDGLTALSANNYVLYFGFGKDAATDETGYNWRKNYDHKPTLEELKQDIEALVNSVIDEKIYTGFTWNGKPVFLSSENQFNFKAAYDLAVQTNGATLPIKFKMGEDADGNVIYHTFTTLNSFSDFYTKAIGFINTSLNEGWKEKDDIDYSIFNI